MNKVFLIGLPASGKTTTGKWLASKLGWDFLDLDHEFERKYQISISDFFAQFGEEEFRKRESEILKETKTLDLIVIACGGGTVTFGNNMDWMLSNGITIFLNPQLDEISLRIFANKQNRPHFKGLGKRKILEKLKEMAENRNDFYSLSKIIWNKPMPNDLLYVAVNQFFVD
jgi:shikimate kinase